MRVGIIGLGRMGEGMSRRMIKEGIETYGYRRNYAKAKKQKKVGILQWRYRFFGRSCSSSKEKGIYIRREIW